MKKFVLESERDRDEVFISKLKSALDEFCKELGETVEWLRSL